MDNQNNYVQNSSANAAQSDVSSNGGASLGKTTSNADGGNTLIETPEVQGATVKSAVAQNDHESTDPSCNSPPSQVNAAGVASVAQRGEAEGQEADEDGLRLPATGGWEPKPELLQVIMSIGFPKAMAVQALFCTGNESPDAAVEWILQNPDFTPSTNQNFELHGSTEALFDSSDEETLAHNYKMVFVVNNELKMGLGKIAAQVAHGTLGLYRFVIDQQMAGPLAAWDESGETKIVVKGDSTEHLLKLANEAKSANIPVYLVQDAGRTQIASGSVTVLALFSEAERLDEITGNLKLL